MVPLTLASGSGLPTFYTFTIRTGSSANQPLGESEYLQALELKIDLMASVTQPCAWTWSGLLTRCFLEGMCMPRGN